MFRHIVALLFLAVVASSQNERKSRTLFRDSQRGGPSKPETMFGRYGRASTSVESTHDQGGFELDPKRVVGGPGALQRSGTVGGGGGYGLRTGLASLGHDGVNGVFASPSAELSLGLAKFGPCGDGLERTIYGKCVSPLVSQDLYIYKAPSYKIPYKPVDYEHKPKVHLNFVFIKSPSVEGGRPQPIVVPPPKEKTHVYLLSKKPHGRPQQVIEVPPNHEKPEVFFVGYKDGDNPLLPGGIDLQTALSQAAHPGGGATGFGDDIGIGHGGGGGVDVGHQAVVHGGQGLASGLGHGVSSGGALGHADGGLSLGHDDGGLSLGHADGGLSLGHDDGGLSLGHDDGGLSVGHGGGGFAQGHGGGGFAQGHGGGGFAQGHGGGSFSQGLGGGIGVGVGSKGGLSGGVVVGGVGGEFGGALHSGGHGGGGFSLGHGGGGFSKGPGSSIALSAGNKGSFTGDIGNLGAGFADASFSSGFGGTFDLSHQDVTVDDLILDLGKNRGGFKNPGFKDGLAAALANDDIDEILIDHGIQDVGRPKLVAEVVGSLHGAGAGAGSLHGSGGLGGFGGSLGFGGHGAGRTSGFGGIDISSGGSSFGDFGDFGHNHGFGHRSSGGGATAHFEGGMFSSGKGFKRSFDDSLEDFKKFGGSVLKADKVVLKRS